jgi:hypothetical protein
MHLTRYFSRPNIGVEETALLPHKTNRRETESLQRFRQNGAFQRIHVGPNDFFKSNGKRLRREQIRLFELGQP